MEKRELSENDLRKLFRTSVEMARDEYPEARTSFSQYVIREVDHKLYMVTPFTVSEGDKSIRTEHVFDLFAEEGGRELVASVEIQL